jgi:putative solute:sodium symporter small subunit
MGVMSSNSPANRAYWQKTLRLSAALLLLWLVVTLGVSLFGDMPSFQFFGWPFGYWVSAQGALIVFCAIVWFYAWAMDRLDRQYGERDQD